MACAGSVLVAFLVGLGVFLAVAAQQAAAASGALPPPSLKHDKTNSLPNDTLSSSSNSGAGRGMRSDDHSGYGRYIKFATDSADKMHINLEFSVPFLTVPLRRADEHSPPSPVEVNVKGIMLAAGLGAVASFVVPALTGTPGPFAALLPSILDAPHGAPHGIPPGMVPPWHHH